MEAGRRIARVIGIDHYADPRIATLRNAVNDAHAVQEVLANGHHYDVASLCEAKATKTRLLELFQQLAAQVTAADRLVIYFAGHGVAEPSTPTGDIDGFLLLHDAEEGRQDSYVSMRELLDALKQLRCRHLLLILDCCFAGTIRWQAHRDVQLGVPRLFIERYERYLRDSAWQVIASAAHNERALDLQLAVDPFDRFELGRRGEVKVQESSHSPFAEALCQGLRGAADLGVGGHPPDNVITATELYLFVEAAMKRLENQLGRAQQRPQLVSLPGRDMGQYVFVVPGRKLELPSAMALVEANSPYRGLNPIERHQAHLFYGRAQIQTELIDLVKSDAGGFIVVHGGSGCGKSSLVRAGLASLAGAWRVLSPIRPGLQPLAALASWKTELGADATCDLVSAVQAYRANAPSPRLVGIIDQAEELFSLRSATADKKEFWRQILTAHRASADLLRLVFTIPTQCVARLTRYDPGCRQLLVPRMTSHELRAAAEGPAQEYVLYFETAATLQRLLDEIDDAPGGLPLLSMILFELYQRYVRGQRNDRTLRASHYEAIGGPAGVIRSRLDGVHRFFEGKSHQATLQRLLSRMVQFDDHGRRSPRRVLLSELRWPEPEEQTRVDGVVRLLRELRLVVLDIDEQHEPFIEPAHPAMVTASSPSSAQAELNAGFLRQRLSQEAKDWARRTSAAQPRGGLPSVRDPRLPALFELVARDPLQFNDVERRFLAASSRRRRWFWGAIAVATGVVILGLVIGLVRVTHDRNTIDAAYATIADREAEARTKLLASYVDKGQAFLAAGDPLRALPWLDAAYQRDCTDPRLGYLLARASEAVSGLVRYKLPGARSIMTRSDGARLRFSPDGTQIATILDDNTVTVWDAQTGQQRHSISPKSLVEDARFTPDGQRLLVTTDGRTPVSLWSLASNEVLPFVGHEEHRPYETIHRAVLSRDGLRVATAGGDGTARIWDAQDGRELATLGPHGGAVRVVAFSPDGRLLVTGSEDHRARIWAPDRGEPDRLLRTLPDHGSPVVTAEFSADGQHIVTGSDSGSVFVWSDAGEEEARIHTYFVDLQVATFSPDGSQILTASYSNLAELWDASTGGHLRSLVGHSNQLLAAVFSPDGAHVASAGRDATMRVWRASTGEPQFILPAGAWVDTVAFDRDSTTVATAGLDGTASTLQVGRSGLHAEIQAHLGPVDALAVDPRGHRFASAGTDRTVSVWSLDTGSRIATLRCDACAGAIPAVAFDGADQTRIVFASEAGAVFAGDLQTGAIEQIVVPQRSPRAMGASPKKVLALSPDGQYAAIGDPEEHTVEIRAIKAAAATVCMIRGMPDGHRAGRLSESFMPGVQRLWTTGVQRENTAGVIVWDARTCAVAVTLDDHLKGAGIVALSPDGRTAASSESYGPGNEPDHGIQLWDATTGTRLATPGRHSDWVRAIVFDDSGRRAASGSADERVLVFDVASRSVLATLSGTEPIAALAFAHGGTKLVVGTSEGSVHVFDLAPEPRSKQEIAALVRCQVPYRIDMGSEARPTAAVLTDQEPEPSACNAAVLRRSVTPASLNAHAVLARARQALVAGDVQAASRSYLESRQLFHALGHQISEAEATLGAAVVAGGSEQDRRNALNEALKLFDAATPSAELVAQRLLGTGALLLRLQHLATSAAVLGAMVARIPSGTSSRYWRNDPDLLYLAALVCSGRFDNALAFAATGRHDSGLIGVPAAFATLAWIAALQLHDDARATSWAKQIVKRYTVAWEARFPVGTNRALAHPLRRFEHADLIARAVGLVSRAWTDENAAALKRLIGG